MHSLRFPHPHRLAFPSLLAALVSTLATSLAATPLPTQRSAQPVLRGPSRSEAAAPRNALEDEAGSSRSAGSVELLFAREAQLPAGVTPAEVLPDAVLSATSAPCSGGPGGDFDWYVRAGESFLFDTTATTVVGGPGGTPTTQQSFTNGRVEVRDLVIEEGGTLRVQGPFPLRVCASRDVIVRGKLDLSGFDAKDVATLNTGYQPEVGGAGGPGGGRGGGSSSNTTSSTPSGDTGFGPFGELEGGGGGESGYAPKVLGRDARRPGGGGGGRFAPDRGTIAVGAAGAGYPGEARSTGAISGLSPAAGGAPGTGPFLDDDPHNDFWGTRLRTDGEPGLGLVRGELARLQGGYGGGGGGDAIPANQFPPLNWNAAHDEKGGPGGGGGGAGHVRALGRIVFGAKGKVLSDGGDGATGENTFFLDHVGGSGGSGSAGMVVLESATQIDFTDGDPANAAASIHARAVGGPLIKGSSNPAGNPIPEDVSYGGPGGPGIVQLHLPPDRQRPSADPSAGLVLPVASFASSDPLATIARPRPVLALPTMPDVSVALTEWARVDSAGVPLRFLFEGLDDEGRVRAREGVPVASLPLFGPRVLDGERVRATAEHRLELSAALLDEVRARGGAPFVESPELLAGSVLEVGEAGTWRAVEVVAAHRDGDRLQLVLSPEEASPAAGAALVLRPRYFRLRHGDRADVLPEGAAVRFAFQAVADDGHGLPDPRATLVDWTGNVQRLSGLEGPVWVRLRIELEGGDALRAPDGFVRPLAVQDVRLVWSRAD